MSLPNSLYANLALVPPAPQKRSAAAIKAAAATQRDAEAHLKRKVDQANAALDRLETRAARFAAEIARYQKRKALTLAKIVNLENAIIERLEEARLERVLGIHTSMRIQQATAALEIIDATRLPREFLVPPKPAAPQPDKVAIKKALAASDDLQPADWGCRLTSKTSLIRK